MKTTESFELPKPTSRTLDGPRLRFEPPNLFVDYDYEHDDSSIEWVQIRFETVIVFEYRQNSCCTVEDLDAFDKLVKYTDSYWLEKMSERWNKFISTHTAERKFNYVHWRIYFDDSGCVDVLSRSYKII